MKGTTVYGTESAAGRSGRCTADRGRRQSCNEVTQRKNCVHTGKQMWFLFPIYGKTNAGLSPGVCFLRIYFLIRVFRAPARDTFGRGPKSVQKGRLNLRFKNPPTLYHFLIWCPIPRVRRTRLLSPHVTNRLSFCAAAAHVLNGRHRSVFRRISQRQRRWSKDDSMTNDTKHFAQTCGIQYQNPKMHSAQGSLETWVSSCLFGYFWDNGQKCLVPAGTKHSGSPLQKMSFYDKICRSWKER